MGFLRFLLCLNPFVGRRNELQSVDFKNQGVIGDPRLFNFIGLFAK